MGGGLGWVVVRDGVWGLMGTGKSTVVETGGVECVHIVWRVHRLFKYTTVLSTVIDVKAYMSISTFENTDRNHTHRDMSVQNRSSSQTVIKKTRKLTP